MNRLSNLLALLILALTCCNGQTKYFRPTGIIDRTEELSGKNVWTSLNDKERVDGYTKIGNSIFGGEIDCNISPLKNIDVRTFKVLAGTQYAKDKNHVYYPLQVPCIDLVDCGVCYYDKILVRNANPATFKYLSKDYATDDRYVFFRGRILQGADAATFEVIDGPQYFYFARDKNSVYIHDEIFKDAEPATFYYNKTDPRNIISGFGDRYIIGDKNNLWEFTPPDQIKKLKNKYQ